MNCATLLLAKPQQKPASGNNNSNGEAKRKAFVTEIEDTGKNTLFLRLNTDLIRTYGLEINQDVKFEVQFQLNRLPICEMHYAVDQLPDLNLVYPEVRSKLAIPWTPS